MNHRDVLYKNATNPKDFISGTSMLDDLRNNTVCETGNHTNVHNSPILIATNATLSFLIYVVNACAICIFVIKRRDLLKIPSNLLLLSLFMCGLLNGIEITFQIVTQYHPGLLFPCTPAALTYRIFVDIFTTFLVETVVMHLCGVSLDRYISLFFALHYKRIVTRKSTRRSIVIMWALPFLHSIIPLSWLYKLIVGTKEVKEILHIERNYSVCSFVIFLAIPMILLGSIFIAMFVEIRRLLYSTPNQMMASKSRISAKQRRVIYLFGFMYICFATLAMPYFSLRLLLDLQHFSISEFIDLEIYFKLLYTSKHLTSLINPLLYTIVNREFRSLSMKLCAQKMNKIRAHYSMLSTRRVKLSFRNNSTHFVPVTDTSLCLPGSQQYCGSNTEMSIELTEK